MIVIYLLWMWLFSNLFIDPPVDFVMWYSLFATIITLDAWNVVKWVYKDRR